MCRLHYTVHGMTKLLSPPLKLCLEAMSGGHALPHVSHILMLATASSAGKAKGYAF